jgi:hypothetical protein
MAQPKLFANAEDFKTCIDRGMAIMMEDINSVPPDAEDLEKMRSLLAIFITATMDMDPKAHLQDDFAVKITSVRQALLAAYNLGKQTRR